MTEGDALWHAKFRYFEAIKRSAAARKELHAAAAEYVRLAKEAGIKLSGDQRLEEFRQEAARLYSTPGASLYREMETWGEAPPLDCDGVRA